MKFFKQTVPSCLKHESQKKRVRELTAEIWTTGRIPPECREKLVEYQATDGPTHQYASRGPKDLLIPSKVESLRKLLESITDLEDDAMLWLGRLQGRLGVLHQKR